jgi:hypothetical protein
LWYEADSEFGKIRDNLSHSDRERCEGRAGIIEARENERLDGGEERGPGGSLEIEDGEPSLGIGIEEKHDRNDL